MQTECYSFAGKNTNETLPANRQYKLTSARMING